MSRALIADGAVCALLVLFALFKARKGFYACAVPLAALILALVGSSYITSAAAEPLAEFVYPAFESRILSRIDLEEISNGIGDLSLLDEGRAPKIIGSIKDDMPDWVWNAAIKLDAAGKLKEGLAALTHGAGDTASAAAKAVLATFVRLFLRIVSFIILYLLIRMLLKGLGILSGLPVIKQIDWIGGFVLGLAEGAILLWIAVWALSCTELIPVKDLAEGTRILSRFIG